MAEDKRDYWTAFAIGAAVGIGATLLLKPEPKLARRILHEIEPMLERARRKARGVREDVRGGASKRMKRARRSLLRMR